MSRHSFKLTILALFCVVLTGCMNLGGLSYKQARVLKNEGFQLTDEGWSLGLPERLLFDFNESEIKTDHQTEINRLATQLLKYNLTKVKIVGHTDNIGNPEYNVKLSEKRAGNVAELFKAQHFTDENIHIVGKGAEQPIKPNDSDEHRAENRRVSIIIIP